MSEWLTHPDQAPALLGGWAALALLSGLATWRARRWIQRLGRVALGAGGGRDAALLAALLALALALLGPRFGTHWVEVPGHGIDMVVLLDVSRSMDAADAPPSRLVRAREAARDVLLALGPGDRAALAVFAGQGALLTPLTSDAAALAEMLASLDTELMSDRGSRFWLGVDAALGAFEPGSVRPRIVLALGDGERAHLGGSAALDAAREAGARVVAGAFGSDAGTALVGAAGPLRDAAGATVITRRETRGFERFAAATGGAVVEADAWGALDAGALLAAARQGLLPGPGGTIRRELPVTHAALPAALAFLLLVAELLANDPLARPTRARLAGALRGLRPGKRGKAARAASRRRAKFLGLAALGLVALVLGATSPEIRELEERVRRTPDDARALVALGVARAEAGLPEEAARAFAAAAVRARTREDAALASYDLGVALLEARDFAGARDAFFDALALAPRDLQAKFDLEWALRALASEPPPPPEAREPSDAPPPPEAEPGDAQEEPQAAEPLPLPTAEPAPGEPSQPREPASPEPEALSPEEIARWLDAVRDQPLPAFRQRLAEPGSPRTGPQW